MPILPMEGKERTIMMNLPHRKKLIVKFLELPYSGGAPMPEPTLPTLRRGSKGEYVTKLQTMLIQRGYDLAPFGADGQYGRKTEEAVKAFQADAGLKSDGICGPMTWASLESGEKELYTVTVQHLSKSTAEEIIKKYGGNMVKE